jgi:hypothetical protein
MAAEFSSNAAQDIPANSSAVFTEVKTPCPCGLVILRIGTGLIRLVNKFFRQNIMNCWRRNTNYSIAFSANIGLPAEGGTPGPLQVGISIDGVVDPSSIMQVEAAANPALYNISKTVNVQVPYPCTCSTVGVVNISNQAITMQNANIVINQA